MAKNLMIQGTMSNAGKSIVTAGILRVLKQDGYRVAPFKSQNMALNSYITKDGFEMGRAQVMQHESDSFKTYKRCRLAGDCKWNSVKKYVGFRVF